jgi:hypothetical protein
LILEHFNMGVFHYKITLVPRAYFKQELPTSLSEVEIGRGGWWAAHPPSARLLSALRTLLPNDQSWGETEEYVSRGDFSSDIRIWKEADRFDDIEFRFSPVADEWSLMQQLIGIARDEQCVLLEGESGIVFEPDEEIVRKQFTSSGAIEFMGDPSATIARAARELEDDAG